ncbi:hypothetical protein PG984_016655 [Apiospora sp. TS-2023a]
MFGLHSYFRETTLPTHQRDRREHDPDLDRRTAALPFPRAEHLVQLALEPRRHFQGISRAARRPEDSGSSSAVRLRPLGEDEVFRVDEPVRRPGRVVMAPLPTRHVPAVPAAPIRHNIHSPQRRRLL